MKIFYLAKLFLAVHILSGCATAVQLKEDAKKVRIVDYIKTDMRSSLEELDQVKCRLGENWRSRESNIEACYNYLRNKAAALGGDIVFVGIDDIRRYEMSSERKSISGLNQCENCVFMEGVVYKQK